MRRNLVQSLIEFGEIETTVIKAKDVRAFAERIISLAVDGSLAARQRAEALLTDRSMIPAEHQKDYDKLSDAKREKVLRSRSGRRHRANKPRGGLKFTAESILHRLFAEVGPKMKRRNESRGAKGGYTRIIKLADRRLGDAAQLAVLQLVKEDDKPRPKLKQRTERKRRAQVKYNVYAGKARALRGRRSKGAGKPAESAASSETSST